MTIKEYFESQKWTVSTTCAAFAPHEYIVRGKCKGSDKDFFAACQFILDHGIRMFYYKHERKYLFVGGYFYWIMGDEVNEDRTIINRCRPDDYDIVFVRRNTWIKSKRAQEEFVQLELDLSQMQSDEKQ